MKRKLPRFVRPDTFVMQRIGKGRRKMQKWRRVRGKHNKTRLGRFSYPVMPQVGYRTPKKEAGRVQGLFPKLVHNVKELVLLDKNSIAIIARIGARKKIELIKKANELGIKVLNINREAKR